MRRHVPSQHRREDIRLVIRDFNFRFRRRHIFSVSDFPEFPLRPQRHRHILRHAQCLQLVQPHFPPVFPRLLPLSRPAVGAYASSQLSRPRPFRIASVLCRPVQLFHPAVRLRHAALSASSQDSRLTVFQALQLRLPDPCKSSDASLLVPVFRDFERHHILRGSCLPAADLRHFLRQVRYVRAVAPADVSLCHRQQPEIIIHVFHAGHAVLRDKLHRMHRLQRVFPDRVVRSAGCVPLRQI